jgi:ornithine cyclodeaminase/alanine dehydrogenase
LTINQRSLTIELIMIILTRRDVDSLLAMTDALTAVEDGFRRLSLGEVTMPQRLALSVAPHAGLHLSMPAFVEGDPGALTVKIVTVYRENAARFGAPMIQGVLLLHDPQTGRLLALMDAEHLTAVRTGAASGVATKYLARPDASTVLLFGAGALAPYQLEAVCAVRSVRRVWVSTRSGAKDLAFCTAMSERLGIPVEPAGDVRRTVAQADVICTATNAQTPLFDGAWLRSGAHINAVGAYTRAMRELDTTTIQRSRIFVDRRQAALSEAGDILIPLEESAISAEHVIGELGEVIAEKLVGRTSAGEITLFKSVGLAMQDAVTASVVYARAVSLGVGQTVEGL